MTRDQAIQRIKKCLALSASSNEHEAAAALRHAQALMREHGIGAADVDASYVSEAHAKAGAGKRIPQPLVVLAQTVGDAFACEPMLTPSQFFEPVMRFIGIDPKPELAAYAYTVLRRKLERDRAAYVATLKRCKHSTEIRRGKVFAQHWILAVAAAVEEFAGTETDQQRIAAYKQQRFGETEVVRGRTQRTTRRDYDAAAAGVANGSQVTLRDAVGAPDDSPVSCSHLTFKILCRPLNY